MTQLRLYELIKKDITIYIVCAVAVLICLLSMLSVCTYQEKINAAWQEQWDNSGCQVKPFQPNITFNIWGDYHGTQDIDQDT